MHMFMCLRELNKRLQKKSASAGDIQLICDSCIRVCAQGIYGFEKPELETLAQTGTLRVRAWRDVETGAPMLFFFCLSPLPLLQAT